MRTIELDASTWTSEQDFYDVFFTAVGAPDWHGSNLDAVEESIRDGDINEVNPPYRIRIVRTAKANKEMKFFLSRIQSLVESLRTEEGTPVELELVD